MSHHRTLAAAAAVVLAIAAGIPSSAASVNHINHLTFSAPMALPGVTLAPGAYTFQIVNPESGLRVVSVSSRDRSRHHFLGLTRAVRRPSDLDRHAVVRLGEARAGEPMPILAWYPIGSSQGLEFIY